MVIKTLHISNFGCFKDFTIEFGERATVMFGKNGSGKTSLLKALCKALSMSEVLDIKDQLIDFGSVDDLDNNGTWCCGTNIKFPNTQLSCTFDFVPSGNPKHLGFTRKNLLVLAYYSDSFPNLIDNCVLIKKGRTSKEGNDGYIGWNSEEGCLKLWIEKLENDLINIRRSRHSKGKRVSEISERQNIKPNLTSLSYIAQCENEVDAIQSCLIKFSKSLSQSILDENTLTIEGIDLYLDSQSLCVNTTVGKQIMFKQLPSGYKRLFCIVLDLAFRSYLVSGKQRTDLAGIVIIDEIDLHLYPDLGGVALKCLMETFPHLQFIVSTKSANVLSNISTTDGKSKILKVVKGIDEPIEYKDLYGLDINSIQQEIMGIKPNSQELEMLLEQCAYMVTKGLKQQSEIMKQCILDKFQLSKNEVTRRINLKLKAIEAASRR